MSTETSEFDAAFDRALELARASADVDEVPIGAVVLDASGTVIGEGRNQREHLRDPTAHAEILALRGAAANKGSWRLSSCTLVVTLEPCTMCAGAAVLSRIDRLVFGAWNEEMGAVGTLWDVVRDRRLNHRPEVVSGVRAQECADLLRAFFDAHRNSDGRSAIR